MRVEPIDLRPFRDGSDADRRRVAQQFDHAARTSGFLSITGHGVDPDLSAEMLDVTAQYFDRPAAEKMAHFVEDRAANRGYAPEGSEALAYSLGEGDLPADHFVPFLDEGPTVIRANNYQRRPGAGGPLPNQMRMGAHTD